MVELVLQAENKEDLKKTLIEAYFNILEFQEGIPEYRLMTIFEQEVKEHLSYLDYVQEALDSFQNGIDYVFKGDE